MDKDKDKERDVEMPKVASREAWLRARKELLMKESVGNMNGLSGSWGQGRGERARHKTPTRKCATWGRGPLRDQPMAQRAPPPGRP